MSRTTETGKLNNGSVHLGYEAFKKIYSIEGSHVGKDKINFLTNNARPLEIKAALVERYQRTYLVEYTYSRKEDLVELQSIDGNSDVEDTYNESFLQSIEDKVREQELNP
jgi:predicted ThiF/HesA family dinucleotide-utilizing enzyme